MSKLNLKPINKVKVTIAIVGTSPMIQHPFPEKAKKQMADKHAGKKTKEREVRDPAEEFNASIYRLADGSYGFPADALKACLENTAHKDLGFEKTLLRKGVFVVADDGDLIRMECDAPIMREDVVRVGNGGTDLRYRPEFKEWKADISFIIDNSLIQTDDLVNLLNRAGFGVGLLEMRPEKGGRYGRFEVDLSKPIAVAA